MAEGKNYWDWHTPNNYHYVKILGDRSLEWGGWETYPKGGGGAGYQTAEEFLRTRKANYSWVPPARIIKALVAALNDDP